MHLSQRSKLSLPCKEDKRDMSVTFYGKKIESPLILGTARYISPQNLYDCVQAASPGLVTVSLRRESAREKSGQKFWSLIQKMNLPVLPNTAGCHTVKEAVTTAHMAREVFNTSWIKLELIGEVDLLYPDVIALVEAARILNEEGFQVFPYMTEDLVIAEKLLSVGCEVLMPWGAPIGSGKGLNNPFGLKALRTHFPKVPMVIDAGLGKPSHIVESFELGYDAVMLNTAISKAGDPVAMAQAAHHAVLAGEFAQKAQPIEERDMAEPSTPFLDLASLT